MVQAVEASAIRPVIDRVFDFDEAPLAYRTLDEATHVGTLAICVP